MEKKKNRKGHRRIGEGDNQKRVIKRHTNKVHL